jgi:hypothetical protein
VEIAQIKIVGLEEHAALSGSDGLQWSAVRVKPRYKKAVSKVLEKKGYERFARHYRRKHQYGLVLRGFQLPRFPGFAFCCFDCGGGKRLPSQDPNHRFV